MRYFIPFIILISILCFSGCETRKSVEEQKRITDSLEALIPKFKKQYPDFDQEKLRSAIREQMQSDSVLFHHYSKKDFSSVWFKDTLNVGSLNQLSSFLSKIEEHGLPAGYFPGADQIAYVANSVDSGYYVGKTDSMYSELARLEKISSKIMADYITGMKYGFLHPDSLFFDDYTIKISYPDSAFYEELYTNISIDPIWAVHKSHPVDSVYLKMQDEYRLLDSLRNIEFTAIKVKGKNINYKEGDKDKNMSAIAGRLMITGEYVPVIDSLNTDTLHQVLDKHMLAAVNLFRKKISYPEDKEVGGQTIDALNRPLTYYQDRLRANMERCRWKRMKQSNDKNIEVNVAAFKLFATEKDSLPLIMNVCVGKTIHKTPMLQSDLSYINLNPKWNIPRSIIRNETVVLQKRDTTYLKRNRMRIYKGNEEIDPSTIDWKKVNPATFSYLIRQDPGDYNSLGRIKFMFNNSFSVYLHDTPSKRYFTVKNRAVSHGCVRVQMPVELAFYCTLPSDDVYKDRLRYTIDRRPVTKEGKKLLNQNKLEKLNDIINLKTKISLFIDYHTVYMQPNDDMLYYADDVYGYDDTILKALSGIKPENPKKKDKKGT